MMPEKLLTPLVKRLPFCRNALSFNPLRQLPTANYQLPRRQDMSQAVNAINCR